MAATGPPNKPKCLMARCHRCRAAVATPQSAPGSCPGGSRAMDNKSAIASTASPPEPDPTWPALGPPRSRPSTVSATRASSCPTRQRMSGRAITLAARSAWLSGRPEASRLWPVEPAYVSGVRAAVWLARRAQAAAVTPERVGRSEPSVPRSGAPAARPVGGGRRKRAWEDRGEGRLHNVVTRVLTRYARSHHIG